MSEESYFPGTKLADDYKLKVVYSCIFVFIQTKERCLAQCTYDKKELNAAYDVGPNMNNKEKMMGREFSAARALI